MGELRILSHTDTPFRDRPDAARLLREQLIIDEDEHPLRNPNIKKN